MTNKELLISRINLLSEEDNSSLLAAVILMTSENTMAVKPDCPYCGSHAIMSNSHFPAKVWREVIKDTVHSNAINYTAQRIGCSHQAVFDMRHKMLMSLQQLPEINEVCLGNVSEFDETIVPDCYKGKKPGSSIPRKPRKHGAKAEKKGGESQMSMCVSAQASSVRGCNCRHYQPSKTQRKGTG